MKTLLQTLIVLSAFVVGSATGEPLFTKEQVVEMGRIILAAPGNNEYKDILWDVQPVFDTKKKSWAFMDVFPPTPGGAIYTLEVREADGFYRLGWATTQKTSPGYERYRIQPSLRKKLNDLIKTFRKP